MFYMDVVSGTKSIDRVYAGSVVAGIEMVELWVADGYRVLSYGVEDSNGSVALGGYVIERKVKHMDDKRYIVFSTKAPNGEPTAEKPGHMNGYHSLNAAEIYASFCVYATVYDNFTDAVASYWQKGKGV